ncbi:MAG TPA: ABC transporter permease [Gemmataceae bacterium]|nr:ABC transporter permease [Gemmataceae bacterium]
MSSKAITEKKEPARSTPRWHVAREVAPSIMEAEQPLLPRLIGGIGLFLIVIGGVPLASRFGASRVFFRVLSELLPVWISAPFAVIGLGCLLYHALRDADYQIRRAYMAMGLGWIGVGLVVTTWRIIDGKPVGQWFLPYGGIVFFLGLLFLLTFVRNETEVAVRDAMTFVIGGLGGAMAIGGLLFGTISQKFLFPEGCALILLGLVFASAFVVVRGVADRLGHLTGWGIGIAGGATFLVAFLRSFVFRNPMEPYTLPDGLVLMGAGLLYAAASLALVSDRPFVVLTRRELGALFLSPIAYTVLLGFAAIGGFLFARFVLSYLLQLTAEGALSLPQQEPVVAAYFQDVFLVICAIFVVPVITMRLLSEEQRTGTMEMLLTLPIDETTVVLSKFFAAWIFFLLVWLPWCAYLVALRWAGGQPFDALPVLAFFIALGGAGAGFVAMGVFCSSLTRNQIGAAILTFAGMLVLTLFAIIPQMIDRYFPNLASFCEHLSYYHLWTSALGGNLTLRDLLFHVSAAVFWLFLTVKVMESRKWR